MGGFASWVRWFTKLVYLHFADCGSSIWQKGDCIPAICISQAPAISILCQRLSAPLQCPCQSEFFRNEGICWVWLLFPVTELDQAEILEKLDNSTDGGHQHVPSRTILTACTDDVTDLLVWSKGRNISKHRKLFWLVKIKAYRLTFNLITWRID